MWAADPFSGALRADCDACNVRALAQSPAHHQSRAEGRMTPEYRAALGHSFGEGLWKAGHERVKAWAECIAATNAGVR